MNIDVIIDVVCPWCYLGKKELDKALEALGREQFNVTYRPYQLSPDSPAEGVDRATYYRRKFGNSPQLQQMRSHLTSRGHELGIHFDFESDCLIGNSMDAHRLIKWSKGAGCQDEVTDAIMKAYFEQCKLVSDKELLTSIAVKSGMDEGIVEKLFANTQDVDMIKKEIDYARSIGVTGVPVYIFDQKLSLVGAEPADKIIQTIQSVQA
ncbi:DsbA family oxidoreductase [Temperatibacter marinus]|uniref:DsbA family oxidoreductase n=1 Tax=Temperatibacter marinus TaxID=1456591 RepID=A0AA52EH92_9PROT|nr:DsbA family oxidoreductase [Temperatibacter marinus]WND02487.1 DsbA family oxidoreductase [Temperatibacter marinus]